MFDWFHGLLSASDVERVLAGAPRGSFLVRVSSKSGKYVIVWVSDNAGSLVHILLDTVAEVKDGCKYCVEGKSGREMYRNVPAVIQRYSQKHLTRPVSAKAATVFDAELRQHKIDTKV